MESARTPILGTTSAIALLFIFYSPLHSRSNETSPKYLVEELRSPDTLRRHQIKQQLRTYHYKDIAKAMAKFANDPNPDIRILMAQTLGELGGTESIRRLRVLYTLEKVARVRRAIFVQIAGIIPKDQKAMTFFSRVVNQDSNNELRHLALTELTLLGQSKAMIKKVKKICKKVWKNDPYDPIKLFAAITLIEMGEETTELWDTLVQSLKNPSVDVRRRAALVLGKNKTPKMFNLLVLAAQDSDPEVRANVSRSLSKTRNKGAIPVLKSLLMDPAHLVRRSAVTSLSLFPGDLVGETIYLLGIKDSDASVRALSVGALENMGATTALDVINELAQKDPDSKVRYISRKAAATLSSR